MSVSDPSVVALNQSSARATPHSQFRPFTLSMKLYEGDMEPLIPSDLKAPCHLHTASLTDVCLIRHHRHINYSPELHAVVPTRLWLSNQTL